MGLSDENGSWVEVNAAFSDLLGVPHQAIIGRSALDFAHPDDHPAIRNYEAGHGEGPHGIHRVETRFFRPDGDIRCGWTSITPTPGPNGEPWTLGVVQDITERKMAETSLKESEEELAAIAAVARCVQSGSDPRDPVVQSVQHLSGADTVALFEQLSPELLVVTAVAGPEIIGTSLPLDRSAPARKVWVDALPVFVPGIGDAGTDPESESVFWQPVLAEGRVIAVLRTTWRRTLVAPDERAVRAVRVMDDEAGPALPALHLRKELERSATTDPLTGALNRRAWAAHVQAVLPDIARRSETLVVAMMDLDNFKQYNDTHGHRAGDDLLRGFVTAARSCLRIGDLFGRWGGEEFIVALPSCNQEQARAILRRVPAGVPDDRTCSIGFTVWDPTEDIHECIERADRALYSAKDGGRNCIRRR